MTTNTRIVKAIVTLPILGTVSRDERGEVVKKGESYRIHIYAAKPDWKETKSMRDMFFVGLLEGEGYTSSPFKRSLDAVLPEGRVLVALQIDEHGCHGWDSLPIHFDQWFSGLGWNLVKDGQVFINDAFIQAATTTHAEMVIGVENGGVKHLQELVSKVIKERLSKELQPGACFTNDNLLREVFIGVYMASNSPWHNLYNTKRWYRLRYHQLQKQPLCEFHLKRNQVVSASIVDHVTPHKGNEALFHDPDNLQSLCKRCHDSVKQRMEKGGTVTEFDDEGRVIW